MMKGKLVFALVLLLAGVLTACGPGGQGEADGLQLWFPASGSDLSNALDTCHYEGEETVSGLMDGLLSGPPPGSELTQVIPSGTHLLDWTVADGEVRVDLSAHYARLNGINRTLADYCIVLTLSQLGDVDQVCIAVAGQKPSRILRPGDVMFSGAEEAPVEVSAALYYRLGTGGMLGYELRVFRLTEGEVSAKVVLDALCAGPGQEELTPLLPSGLLAVSARLEKGVCYANFSALLLENIPDSREEQELVISSIVETLCSLDEVEQVQIMVEGELVDRYGLMDLSSPLFSHQSQ